MVGLTSSVAPSGENLSAARDAGVPWRRVLLYYVVAYVGTYGTVALFLAWGGSYGDSAWVLFAQISMLVPAASAILLQRFVFRGPVRAPLAIRLRPNRWFVVAWL